LQTPCGCNPTWFVGVADRGVGLPLPDAIRALVGRVRDGPKSIRMNNAALGLRQEFVSVQRGQR
jgi:hypothetical protein